MYKRRGFGRVLQTQALQEGFPLPAPDPLGLTGNLVRNHPFFFLGQLFGNQVFRTKKHRVRFAQVHVQVSH